MKSKEVDLLLEGATVVTMDDQGRVLNKGLVAIREGRIVAVEETPSAFYLAKERIDAEGCLVIPGLVNCHTHAAMTLFRGLAEDLPLKEWLTRYIFPAEARFVNPSFVYWGSKLACLEMVKGGITAFCDMYFFEEEVAKAASEVGVRALLGEGLLDFPSPSAFSPQDALRRTEVLICSLKDDSLVRPCVAPHAVYTCSRGLLEKAADLARRYDLPLVIHLHETKEEVEEVKARYGKSPLRYLEELGILGPKVLACHCVWLEDEEMELLASKGVKVVHCPESNLKLGAGIAPLSSLLRRGVKVGLGTDGAASNNDLDLFGEMDVAAKLQKGVSRDPSCLKAKQVFHMATKGGAGVLGMEVGSIAVGKRADLVVVELRRPHLSPLYDLYAQLVYAVKGSDVREVIIGGKVVLKGGVVVTVEEGEVLERVREISVEVKKVFSNSPCPPKHETS